MTHLDPDTLARLIDEPPTRTERRHLEACERCAAELRALEEQRRALADLPATSPPAGEWEALEARLGSEGLIGARGEAAASPSGAGRPHAASRPGPWLRSAAAVLLFLGGTLFGAVFGSRSAGDPADAGVATSPTIVDDDELSLAEAQELVNVTHQWHLDAVALYRDRLERAGGGATVTDPVTRFVAIEQVLTATEAAVRANPGDPFLNGMLLGATAERRDALEGLSLTSGPGGRVP